MLCVATMFKFTLHHFWLYILDVSLACYISHPAHLVFSSLRFAKPCCATTISCKKKANASVLYQVCQGMLVFPSTFYY